MSAGSYGQQVRAARKAAGVQQNTLAARVGVTKAFMCDIELGRRNPSRAVATRIEAATGVRWELDERELRAYVAELEALVVSLHLQLQRLIAQHGTFPDMGYTSVLKGL